MPKAPSFYDRLVSISVALMVCLASYVSNLDFSLNTSAVVYPNPTNQITVGIRGEVRRSGIYFVSANSMTLDVIDMAEMVAGGIVAYKPVPYNKVLTDGSSIDVNVDHTGTAGVSVGLMPVKQRLALGIPLDINEMSLNDFDLVPGIGPGLAKKILEYRQTVGGVVCRDDLSNISGIGSKKYQQLMIYFK